MKCKPCTERPARVGLITNDKLEARWLRSGRQSAAYHRSEQQQPCACVHNACVRRDRRVLSGVTRDMRRVGRDGWLGFLLKRSSDDGAFVFWRSLCDHLVYSSAGRSHPTIGRDLLVRGGPGGVVPELDPRQHQPYARLLARSADPRSPADAPGASGGSDERPSPMTARLSHHGPTCAHAPQTRTAAARGRQ